MGYVLLWIESLAVSLLLVATLTACNARFRWRRWLRAIGLVLLTLIPLAAYVGLTVLAGWLQFGCSVTVHYFWPMLALTLFYTAGAVWIMLAGRRRNAAVWPAWKLAAALLVAVVLHMTTFCNMDMAARQRLAIMQVEVGIMALSAAPARVPDSDNAALIYRQISEAVGPQDSWPESWRQKWMNEWTDFDQWVVDPEDPDLQAYMQQQAPVIALLHEAGDKPGCCFDSDYSCINVSTWLQFPDIQNFRNAARLLSIHARFQAAKGNIRAAMEDADAMFEIAGHVGDAPLLVPMLVAIALDDTAVNTLQAILTAEQVSAEDLEALNIDAKLSFHGMLQRAFQMEKAFGLSSICTMSNDEADLSFFFEGDYGFPLDYEVSHGAPLYRVFLLNNEVAAYIRYVQEYDLLLSRPYHETKSDWDEFEEKLKTGTRGISAHLLLGSPSCFIEAAARADAQRRLAQIALAMCRYRARHGNYPDKLEDLTGEFIAFVPCDPFDGKPMRLKSTKSGPVIYSIAPDMKDDGGTPVDWETRTGDLVFELSL